ncbi:MAG: hypothetical protein KGJ86_21095 [Chloroflexota bacterium]|nr:hypothetical protein [Chloroflexota bacterium]
MDRVNECAYGFEPAHRLPIPWPLVLILILVGGLVLFLAAAVFWLSLRIIGPVLLIVAGLALMRPWSSRRQ